MSFIKKNGKVISFASIDDVLETDLRLFEQNEGLSEDLVESKLLRATERVVTYIERSDWFKSKSTAPFDPLKIVGSNDDITELTVCVAMSEYILPSVADFDNVDKSERNKMGYYSQRALKLLTQLLEQADWYDFNSDGTVSADESKAGVTVRKRVR